MIIELCDNMVFRIFGGRNNTTDRIAGGSSSQDTATAQIIQSNGNGFSNMQPGISNNQRREPRIKLSVLTYLNAFGRNRVRAFINNVSASGLGIELKDILQVGEEVEINIPINKANKSIKAKVLKQHEEAKGSFQGHRYGLAIIGTDLRKEVKEAIENGATLV